MDTVTRNFLQQQAYLSKSLDQMTDRDWKIFREDNDIQVKGNRVPNPIRNWQEIQGSVSGKVMRNIDLNGYNTPYPIQ